jgi:hypothetical protein
MYLLVRIAVYMGFSTKHPPMGFQTNFTGIILECSSSKIVQRN